MQSGFPCLLAWCATAIAVWGHGTALAETTASERRLEELSYEVIDGWAVHAGDIVLGRVVATEGGRPKLAVESGPPRRASTTGYRTPLWPQGMIPYVIDTDFSAETRQDILAAIEEWNAKTVITLYPRTREPDYVRFRTTNERCRSNVGKVGGEQSIWWVREGRHCGDVSFLLHEIGHTVGLWHEHQRTDRDEYVSVREEGLFQTGVSWIVDNGHPADGPYDFASVMHYHPLAHSRDGLPVLETIPPGIQIRSPDGGLSAGDIHGVSTLYGRRPWPTTISTNPPGLDIYVNGKRFTTPTTFFWPHGHVTSVRAPSPQEKDDNRYIFARWSDNRAREHNVKIGEEGTWFEANFIVQHSVSGTAYPASAGSVTFDPPSPDGYYTTRTELSVIPVPKAGTTFKFWKWGLWRNHGLSSDPARILITNPDQFAAHFTTEPLFRIDSTVGPFLLYINGESQVGPVSLHPSEYGEAVRVSVPPVQTRPASTYRPSRYRFQGWLDGGPHARQIDVSGGGKLVAVFETEYYLDSAISEPTAGKVAVDPPAPAGDGYHPGGSSVHVTAVSNHGWDFVQWLGDSTSAVPTVTVEMDRDRSVRADFAKNGPTHPGAPRAVKLTPSEHSFLVGGGEQHFRVDPPPGAKTITIRLEPSNPDADVELVGFARKEGISRKPMRDKDGGPVDADFRAIRTEGGETIEIAADSVPSIDPDQSYLFSISSSESPASAAGIVRIEIETDALARAGRVSPRALTFVAPSTADAPPQRVTLSNTDSGIMRYRFESDMPWLRVQPREGMIQPYGSAEIAIHTHSAGIEPDTYHRELKVRLSDESGRPIGQRTVRIAFAVTPPPGTATH